MTNRSNEPFGYAWPADGGSSGDRNAAKTVRYDKKKSAVPRVH